MCSRSCSSIATAIAINETWHLTCACHLDDIEWSGNVHSLLITFARFGLCCSAPSRVRLTSTWETYGCLFGGCERVNLADSISSSWLSKKPLVSHQSFFTSVCSTISCLCLSRMKRSLLACIASATLIFPSLFMKALGAVSGLVP